MAELIESLDKLLKTLQDNYVSSSGLVLAENSTNNYTFQSQDNVMN